MSHKDAARAGGISYDTFRNWTRTAEHKLAEAELDLDQVLQDGLPDDLANDPFVKFLKEVMEADTSGLEENFKVIRAATTGSPIFDIKGKVVGRKEPDWRAAEKLIGLRRPEYLKQIQEHTGPHGGPLQTQQVPTDPVLIAQQAYKKARDAGRSHDDIVANLLALGIDERDLEGLE